MTTLQASTPSVCGRGGRARHATGSGAACWPAWSRTCWSSSPCSRRPGSTTTSGTAGDRGALPGPVWCPGRVARLLRPGTRGGGGPAARGARHGRTVAGRGVPQHPGDAGPEHPRRLTPGPGSVLGIWWAGRASVSSGSTRQVRQNPVPNGVRWMLRRTTLRTARSAWRPARRAGPRRPGTPSGPRAARALNQISPRRNRLLRYAGTSSTYRTPARRARRSSTSRARPARS